MAASTAALRDSDSSGRPRWRLLCCGLLCKVGASEAAGGRLNRLQPPNSLQPVHSADGSNHSDGTESRACPAAAVSFTPTELTLRQKCAAGMRIVFVTPFDAVPGSALMRGHMPDSILRQTFQQHGIFSEFTTPSKLVGVLRSSTAECGAVCSTMTTTICVLIKYEHGSARTCRENGAQHVVIDIIDNFRSFDESTMNASIGQADAVLVQTEEHAQWLAERGHRALLVPHAHGNLNGWSVARGAPLPSNRA